MTGEPSPLAAWGIENNETGRAVFFAGPGPGNTWWSIDPKTGATIGRGDGGEGQAAAEYENVQKQNLSNLKCFLEALGGGSGGDYVACMTGLDSKTGRMGAAVGLRTQMGGFDNQAKAFGALSQAASILKGIDRCRAMTMIYRCLKNCDRRSMGLPTTPPRAATLEVESKGDSTGDSILPANLHIKSLVLDLSLSEVRST
jgi:hypothetical protein